MQDIIDAFAIGATCSAVFGVGYFIFMKPVKIWQAYAQIILLGMIAVLHAFVSTYGLIMMFTDFEFAGLMLLFIMIGIPIVILTVKKICKNLKLLKSDSFKK